MDLQDEIDAIDISINTISKLKIKNPKEEKTVKESNKRGRPVGSKRPDKWTPEIIEYLKQNCLKPNTEIAKGINEKFGFKPTPGTISFYLKRNKISKRTHSEIAKEAYEKIHKKCQECNDEYARCLIDGKDVCRRCFDLLKHGKEFVRRKERGEADYYGEEDITDALEE